MPVITTAGENLIAAQQTAGQNLIIDQIIFGNISGLDHNAIISKAEGKPSTGDIVATELITQTGLVNDNTVVYSITMPSTMGTYSFNWMGLYSSAHDTVVAIAYTPLQEKRATVGEVLGNVLNKNFAIEFVGASDTTGITIDAQSWQLDYTARLETMDEIQRQALKEVYGQAAFLNDAFKCEYNGTNYVLKSGKGILGGLVNAIESDTVITPSALPKTIWVDAYQIKTMAGVQNTFDVIINDGTELTDHITNGVAHSLVKIALVNSQASINDERINVTSDLSHWTKGNTPDATTTQKGFAKLIDSVTSSSVILAATAKAVKAAYDKGVEALNKANTKADASHSHGEGDLPNASTSAQGVVQLSSSTTGTSETLGATQKVIKTLRDLITIAQNTANGKADASHSHGEGDLPNASTTAQGVVQLSSSTTGTSTVKAATEAVIKTLKDLIDGKAASSHSHGEADLPSASTSAKGVVQLSSSTAGTSESIGATQKVIKTLNDLISGKLAASSYTASDILAKLKTVDGDNSGLDSDKLGGTDHTLFKPTIFKSSNGYWRCNYTGLIIQWGAVSVSSSLYVSYPITFPSVCLGAHITNYSFSNTVGNKQDHERVASVGTSNFQIIERYEGASSVSFYWFAIGY